MDPSQWTLKGLRRYLRRERRGDPRHSIRTEVQFYVWDTVMEKAITGKALGCLTAVSMKGACLQTNHLQIDGHHLFLDHDHRDRNLLAIEIAPSSGQEPWIVRAKIISYDKFPNRAKYQFDVRLQFVNPSETELRNLEQVIKYQASRESSGPNP